MSEVQHKKGKADDKDVEVGYYRLEKIEYDPEKKGVLISTSDLMPTFRNRYRNDVRRVDFKQLPKSFESFTQIVSTQALRMVRALGPYWEMFWELAVATPVQYLNDGPIRESALAKVRLSEGSDDVENAEAIIKAYKNTLEKFDFRVIFDNINLQKPIKLPSKNAEDFGAILTALSYEKTVIGLPLKFSGYLFTQNGRAIYPEDLRGILIRIKNIAIGGYDRSCLKFDTIQGMRFDWLSGEINVEHGMEEALNIDRNSFNEIDPHYTQLQKYVHRVIKQKRIFYESQKRDQQTIMSDSDDKIERSVRKVLRSHYKIRRVSLGEARPLIIDDENREIIIDEFCPYWLGSGSKRRRVERIVAAVNIALLEEEEVERDKLLLRLLQDIL